MANFEIYKKIYCVIIQPKILNNDVNDGVNVLILACSDKCFLYLNWQ